MELVAKICYGRKFLFLFMTVIKYYSWPRNLICKDLGLPTADAVPVFYRAFFQAYSLYVYYDLYEWTSLQIELNR